MSILERIQSPADLKALPRAEVDALAAEQAQARRGGHGWLNRGVGTAASAARSVA